jgi:hypothetical protein
MRLSTRDRMLFAAAVAVLPPGAQPLAARLVLREVVVRGTATGGGGLGEAVETRDNVCGPLLVLAPECGLGLQVAHAAAAAASRAGGIVIVVGSDDSGAASDFG